MKYKYIALIEALVALFSEIFLFRALNIKYDILAASFALLGFLLAMGYMSFYCIRINNEKHNGN